MRIGLIIGIPIVILALLVTTFIHWTDVKAHFYDYSLTSLVNIIVLLTLSVIISLYSSRFIGNEAKKKEIVMNLFDSLEKYVHSVYDKGMDYVNNPVTRSRQQEAKILNSFKQCYIIYNSLENIHTNHPKILKLNTSIIVDIINLKIKLTDTPFGTNEAYDAQKISEMHIIYQNLHKKLCDAKIETFL
jgi:hypothetical protein